VSARKPVIGVVGYRHAVPRDFGELPVTGVPPTYLESIVAAGGRPVVLSPDGLDLLDVVDALVLTGGGDVEPARYGGSGPADDVDAERDDAEIAMVLAAAAARLPVLGVCRGLQVLAVAYGGILEGGLDHRLPEGGHDVRTARGSLVRDLLGARTRTSALHQQAVRDPGPRWRATAWADDGTVEAIEPTTPGWPALGVQWHPELTVHPVLDDPTGPALFGWLARCACLARAR
jgi:putative glutamine amidotransferase